MKGIYLEITLIACIVCICEPIWFGDYYFERA